ncbi:Mediator of RNA polymerase II transcription subunit 7b-like protein [Drosera capensis]
MRIIITISDYSHFRPLFFLLLSTNPRHYTDTLSPPSPATKGLTATYPPPPPYYKLYKNYATNPSSTPTLLPPIQGTYVCFGANYTTDDVLPGLEEQGVRQLYPKGNNIHFKKELRSLNRELQLHFLELADILVERPSQYARRVEEISVIFKNLHHLLNSLRPHEARATLIHVMELQIQRRKMAGEDIKRRREEAQRLLKEALVTLDGQ